MVHAVEGSEVPSRSHNHRLPPQSRSAERNKIALHGAEGGMLGTMVLRIPEPAFSRRHACLGRVRN